MDLKQLLGKLDLLEGTMSSAEKNPTGPKFTGQWKGTDKGLPGRKLVGDSILKDLQKGPSPKTKEQELAEQFEQFLQQLEEENLGVEEKRPSRKGSRPARDYGKSDEPSKRYKKVEESAQPREKVGRIIRRVLGDKLVWNPDYSVLYKNTRYSKTQRVDYYAMKSIKVLASRNELPELGSMLKAELEKAGYPVYKFSIGPLQISFQTRSPVQIIEPSEGINENAEELNVGDDVIITGPVEHRGETGVIDSFGQDKRFVVVNLYNHGKKSFHSSDVSFNDYADSDAEEAEMYDRDPEFRDWAARQDVDESRGDPHKILLNKLRDIERKPSTPSAEDDAKRAEQAKADYKKYVEKMKKKNPNFIPLYKIDEYGADQPTGTAGQTNLGSTTQPNQAQQAEKAKEVAQATQTLKAATGATVPTTSLAKAIDAASQGTAVDAQSMKALEPIMKDVAAVASDPKLASQFKSLASQINQTQAKQAQQKT